MAQAIRVKQYTSPGDMQKDMRKMASQGWAVQAQSQGEGHINLMRTIAKTVFTGGIGLVVSGRSRSKGKLIVTYVKG